MSKRKNRPWRIVEIQFFRVFFVILHSGILLFKVYVSVVVTILHAADTHRWESEEIYSFLICVVAPVDKDYNAGTPKCGFIFPAFEDRSVEPGKIDVFFEIPEHLDEGFLNSLIVYQKI